MKSAQQERQKFFTLRNFNTFFNSQKQRLRRVSKKFRRKLSTAEKSNEEKNYTLTRASTGLIGLKSFQPLKRTTTCHNFKENLKEQETTSVEQKKLSKKDVLDSFRQFSKIVPNVPPLELPKKVEDSKEEEEEFPDIPYCNEELKEDTPRVSPCEELFAAAFNGDIETLKMTIEKGVDVNFRNYKNQLASALHAATAQNQIEAMDFLLAHNADVNITDKALRTPLHLAVCQGSQEATLLLIGKGAKINVRDYYGYSPLHWAIRLHHFEIAENLLLFDGNINFKKHFGSTVLHECMANGDLEALKFLLSLKDKNLMSQKILFNVRDEKGDTPIMKAIASDQIEAIKLLLDSTDEVSLNIKNEMGMNIFHLISKYGAIKTLSFFIEAKSKINLPIDLIDEPDSLKYKRSPIHYAIKNPNLEIISKLVELGCNINIQDVDGNTPAHLALKMNRIDVVKHLQNLGAKLNLKNKSNEIVKKICKDL